LSCGSGAIVFRVRFPQYAFSVFWLCLCFSRFFQDDTVAEVEPKADPPPESALVEGIKKGGIEMLLSLLSVAPAILAQWAIWLMLILFLLIYAPGFYDSFINLFPSIRDKPRAANCKRLFRYQYVGSQFVTPTILGQHKRLNPLILILWLLIWGWLWGPFGVLIAVPLLVGIKLVASHSKRLDFLVDLIETEA
jgi:predicted PurR-regulated permease PerM